MTCRRRDLNCLRDFDCERREKTYEKTKNDTMKFDVDKDEKLKNEFVSTISFTIVDDDDEIEKINAITKFDQRRLRASIDSQVFYDNDNHLTTIHKLLERIFDRSFVASIKSTR